MAAEAMGERPLQMERRMTDAEALMWTVEKDPALRSSFVQITLLDRAPDFDRFRRRMARAVVALPRLAQRVVSPPARVGPPEWADDPTFDLDFHVRRVAVPPPGTERQLLDAAALVLEDAFDRARPLWQLTVVEGLEGGRAALLAKMHHTITDGVGGVRLSMQFIDLAADGPDPGPPPPPSAVAERGLVATVAGVVGHNARRQLGVARRLAGGLAGHATRPWRLVPLAGDTVELTRSLARQAAVTEPARSPLWTERSLRRRFETVTVPLADLKRSAKALGGTVNDLYVAALAGGAGAYHRARGADPGELRMAMAVNRRSDRSVGGNAFSPSRLLVPTGADPAARFEETRSRLARTKSERALGVTEGLAGLLNLLPTAVVVRFARMQAQTVDFASSNLRAADFELYVAGARIIGNFPMGPTAGTAFNATAMSYRDRFDVGLNIDTAAVDDPDGLRLCIGEAFDELFAAAGVRAGA